MYKGKIVPFTKEQGEQLEKDGIPVNELIGNMAPEQDGREKSVKPLKEQSIQSLGTGQRKNYIFFTRKKGI